MIANSTEPQIPEYKLPEPKAGELRGVYQMLPYIGPRIDRKETDEEPKQPQMKTLVGAFVFHMEVPAHLQAYNEIMQQVAEGYTAISLEDNQYNTEANSFDVLLRWVTQYYIAPAEDRPYAV
jgi:hypothetical protein